MRWLRFTGMVVLVAFAIFGAARLAWGLLPSGPSCVTSSQAEIWTPDRAYKATLSKKDCNMSESIFYSVRVDAVSPRAGRPKWFTIRNIDTDEYPENPPQLAWAAARQLEITMPTRTLRGTVTEHVGDDLVVARVFAATKPDAFPNYP